MSCFPPNFVPNPSRVWSRVQNQCTFATENVVSTASPSFEKGNILQYRKNADTLTQTARYSKIARGQWTSRTTWASQSCRGPSNPNTRHLARVGAIGDGCIVPPPVPTNDSLPDSNPGQPSNSPVIPPPTPIEPSPWPYIPPAQPITPIVPKIPQDGGRLICGTHENPCTGEITRAIARDLCASVTFSDVPGNINEMLCWNPRLTPWIPRYRLQMTNSTDKWPVNSKRIK